MIREQFESWIENELDLEKGFCSNNINQYGEYTHSMINSFWEVWVASRKNVNLKMSTYDEFDTPRQFEDSLVEHLDALGISHNFS